MAVLCSLGHSGGYLGFFCGSRGSLSGLEGSLGTLLGLLDFPTAKQNHFGGNLSLRYQKKIWLSQEGGGHS